MKASWHTGSAAALSTLLLSTRLCAAAYYDLNVTSDDSVKSVAKGLTADLVSFYNGNQPGGTPGLLPQPYYWWEAGAFLGALVDYWYYTGDTTYNQLTEDGLLFQVGPYNDYMPPNQTLTEGNDDQGFWGMAVMSAAEYNFPNPSPSKPQWLALAQAVFNTQAARWDTQYCGGGLRWQIFTWNNGFNYKNAISQACFFNIAARLALYTGNSSYADWAIKTWDWMADVKLLTTDTDSYYIYDGTYIENCSAITPYQFSYNPGAFLLGAAAMYAYSAQGNRSSDSALWKTRVDGLLNGTDIYFFKQNDSDPYGVMFEAACEPVNLCNTDEKSFKAYLSRWMAATTKWAPWTYDRIKPLMATSAEAAVTQCVGGSNGRMCGLKWANNSGQWDGTTGVGQQMAAMEVVLANLIHQSKPPVTNDTGGTSTGDPGGGGSDIGRTTAPDFFANSPITTGDKAGAIIVTIAVLGAFVTALVFMIADENKTTAENWGDLRGSIVPIAGAAALEKGRVEEADRSSTETGEKGDLPGSAFGQITPVTQVVPPEQRRGPVMSDHQAVSGMPIGQAVPRTNSSGRSLLRSNRLTKPMI